LKPAESAGIVLRNEVDIPFQARRSRADVKYTDDYDAKLEIWARDAKVYAMPRIRNLPRFGWKKFNTYEELNAWKKSLIEQLMLNGGAEWTK
jgi:hypothetical protein